MKKNECLQWLKKEGILKIAQEKHNNLSKVFRDCLATKKDDNILILADTGLKGNSLSAVLAGCFYLHAKEAGLNINIAMQEGPTSTNEPASEEISSAFLDQKEKSIIIALFSNKLGRIGKIKSFRKYCRNNEMKFASTSSLGYIPNEYISQLMDTFSIDYSLLRKRQAVLKGYLDRADEVMVRTPSGTDIKMDISNFESISADGDFRKFGSGGNLPAGEVYTAPVEDTASGTIVIDASSRNKQKTELIREPITVTVKKGRAVKIEGDIEAKLLDESLSRAESESKYPERVRKIAELGIGMNTKARVIGTTIIDEKAYGTAHIALGSNYWFGGTIRAKIHLDQVMKSPSIFCDGKKIRIP